MRRHKRRTIRIRCDSLLYDTEDGEKAPLRTGEWVEFRLRFTPEDARTVWMLGSLETEAEMIDALPALIRLLSRKIVAWNWHDLDAEPDENGKLPPLPPPSPAVLAQRLDVEELVNLANLYADAVLRAPEKKSSPS